MKLREKIYQLAGDDPALIQKCATKTQAQFLEIGLFVPLLFVLCLLSSYSTFSELFQTPVLTFALALFFTWMLTNIYSLLLYTITRSALPDTTQTSYSLFSLGIRMAFVCFISLIVSMPIECVLYSRALDKDMVIYKAEAKALNNKKIQEYYTEQYNEIKIISNSKEYQLHFIKEKEQQRIETTANMERLVDTSNYYLQRLSLLNTKHSSCWIITLLFMIALNIPVYQKHKIRDSDYYRKKGVVERRIVELNYYVFKKKYSDLLSRSYNKKVVYSEPFQDAPYNKIRKKDTRNFFTQESLLTELYNV